MHFICKYTCTGFVKWKLCRRYLHNLTFESSNLLVIPCCTFSLRPIFRHISKLVINQDLFNKHPHVFQLNLREKRLFQTSCALQTFWEKDAKGGYPIDKSNISRTQLVRDGLKELKSEIKLWKEEVKEKFDSDPILVYRPGEVDKIWDFTLDSTYSQWVPTSDSDHGEGHSKCQLFQSKAGKALFEGNLSTQVPKDGRTKKAGYCNIKSVRSRKSFKRESFYDWHMYTHVVLRVRGDGRSYLINIATAGYFDIMWNDVYHFILFTRGGPYWQVAKIPFSKFFLSSKGRVQDKQYPIPLEKVTSLGITAGDKINGPFHLEIDYIGLDFDPTHTEEFAYEMYKMPKYIVAT